MKSRRVDISQAGPLFAAIFVSSFLPLPGVASIVFGGLMAFLYSVIAAAIARAKLPVWLGWIGEAASGLVTLLYGANALAAAAFSVSAFWFAAVAVAFGIAFWRPYLRITVLVAFWAAMALVADGWPLAYVPILVVAGDVDRSSHRWLGSIKFACMMGMSLVAEARYVPSYQDQLSYIKGQNGVEVMEGHAADGAPLAKKDVFCDPRTLNRYVTPHLPFKSVLELKAGGGAVLHDLGWEAPDKSWLEDSHWTFFSKDQMRLLRLSDFATLVSNEVEDADVAFYVNGVTSATYVTANFDLVDECRIYDKATLRLLERLPGRGLISYCQPVDEHVVVMSHTSGVYGRTVRLVDWRTHIELAQWSDWPEPWPFYEVTFDTERSVFWVPNNNTGRIVALDSHDLSEKSAFRTRPGVRGVVVDSQSGLLYLWNYFSGSILESDIQGNIRREWRLGPMLRNLRWDCEDGVLLGGTMSGVFRVRVR